MSSSELVLNAARQWREQGVLRHLDVAWMEFVHQHDPQASPLMLLISALVAHMEGRGHSCLPLAQLANDAPTLLNWDSTACEQLTALMEALPQDLDSYLKAIKSSPLVSISTENDKTTPMILVVFGAHPLLYLRRYWEYEQQVAQHLLQRIPTAPALQDKNIHIENNKLLSRLFSENAENQQKTACLQALRSRLSIITGGPGTGKTYTAARLLGLMFACAPNPEQMRVALAAPTGKAAARLKESIDSAAASLPSDLAQHMQKLDAALTLHSLLGVQHQQRRPRYNRHNPLALDALIVDEASMIHLEMMADLLEALPKDARLILLGDKDQLASVEAGAVLGQICASARAIDSPLRRVTTELQTSRRFSGNIGVLARAVNAGDMAAAQRALQPEMLLPPTYESIVDLAVTSYREYACLINSEAPASEVLKAFERFRVLCAVRQGAWGVSGLNAAIEQALTRRGLLKAGRGVWYAGRPVMVTRNDASLGIFNGDIGIALPSVQGRLRVYFSAQNSVSTARLAHVETAFAITVHKSQGSEFEHAALVLSASAGAALSRELVYTGITRAKARLSLVMQHPSLLREAIQRPTQRSSGLGKLVGELVNW